MTPRGCSIWSRCACRSRCRRRASRRGAPPGRRLAAIEATLRAMREAAGPLDAELVAPEAEMAFHRADVGFHEAVAMAGGNRILTCLFEAMAPPLQRSFFMSRRGRQLRGQNSQHTIAAHARILERVQARDSAGAEEAMRAHLADSGRDLRAAFEAARRGRGPALAEKDRGLGEAAGGDRRGRRSCRRRARPARASSLMPACGRGDVEGAEVGAAEGGAGESARRGSAPRPRGGRRGRGRRRGRAPQRAIQIRPSASTTAPSGESVLEVERTRLALRPAGGGVERLAPRPRRAGCRRSSRARGRRRSRWRWGW